MSILNFSDIKYVKTFDADEEIRLGSISTATNGLLKNIRVNSFIKDFASLSGTEQLTMKIYNDVTYQSVYMKSDVFNISDVTFDDSDPTKTSFLGYFSFNFDSPRWLNLNNVYYPTVTISNYTPSGDSFYLGLAYDYPDPIYDNGATNFFDTAIAMQVFMLNVRNT